MNDGIYHVTFSSNSSVVGEGIAVIKAGTVNGGDSGYLYIGDKTASGTGFTSSLQIKQWNLGARSIFGPIKEFVLDLRGSNSGDGFLAEGSVSGQPHAKITIRGRYLAAAA